MDSTSFTTALNTSRWFLKRNEVEEVEGADGISNIKMQKLLYYAQGCVYAITDKKLFGEKFEAWIHGPVIPSIYEEYKSFGKNPIASDNIFFDEIATEATEILEGVYTTFGQYSAWKLRNMTHEEKPWLEAKRSSDHILNDETIKNYFKEHYVEV